jgi:predicted CoA-substrate-specific enzyme activase
MKKAGAPRQTHGTTSNQQTKNEGQSTVDICGIGIDLGSATSKIACVDEKSNLVWHAIETSEARVEQQAQRLLSLAQHKAGSKNIPIVTTGYGRNLLTNENKSITEITCHARGVYQSLHLPGTLIDIGGQDSKVMVISDAGKVTNFIMNDKCAAGTGRFLEGSATRLQIPMEQLGQTAAEADGEVSISSTCAVFAESEIVSLIARGQPVPFIVRGLIRALMSRVASLAGSIQSKAPYMFSGGVANIPRMQEHLADALGHPVRTPQHPQLMGAYGAALLAAPACQR